MQTAALLLGLILAVSAIGPAQAQDAVASVIAPVPPCAGEPQPAFPAADQPPEILVLRDGEIGSWQPPGCLGLNPLASNAVIATAGRFHEPGGIDAVARRVGQISRLTGIRYFSVRNEGWRTLYAQAHALDGNGADRRDDFSAAEVVPGTTLRFLQEENSLLSPVVYRLNVRERSADRLVYEIVNETPLRALFLRAGEPGDFRQIYAIEREAGETLRYYSLVDVRFRTGPFSLSSWSFRYRAHAYFRFVAGQSSDFDLRRASSNENAPVAGNNGGVSTFAPAG